MKNFKLTNRIFALLLAAVMMLGTSVQAFAAESSSGETPAEAEVAYSNQNTAALIGNVANGTSGSSITYLAPYLGVTKTFTVQITSYTGNMSGSQSVQAYLFRQSDNRLMASWKLGVNNTTGTATFTLPQSGNYSLSVYNGSGATINVVGTWN